MFDNAYYIGGNGKLTDYEHDDNFFLTGIFDTGGTWKKNYTVTRYPDCPNGITASTVLRLFDDLDSDSVNYWSIGNSSLITRAFNSAGRFIVFPVPKAKAADQFLYERLDGDVNIYIFKGKNV